MSFSGVKFLKTFSFPSLERVVVAAAAKYKEYKENITNTCHFSRVKLLKTFSFPSLERVAAAAAPLKNLGRPGQKNYEKRSIGVFELSGHLVQRYIMHLGSTISPGLDFEVPGPQNPVKKLILKVFLQFCCGLFFYI